MQREARRLGTARNGGTAHNPDPLPWSLVVIDEAHFLKNPLSWWGLLGQMCGAHARRFVAVTGTPYTTKSQDLATLCAMIDPSHGSADVQWWKDKITSGAIDGVLDDNDDEDYAGPCPGDADDNDDAEQRGMNPALARYTQEERDAMDGDELERVRQGEAEMEQDEVKAEQLRKNREERRQIEEWRGTDDKPHYFLRREKATAGISLPKKTIQQLTVRVSEDEWDYYAPEEVQYVKWWLEWQAAKQAAASASRWLAAERRLFIMVVAQMQLCRMYLPHTAAHGGRELTCLFTETRGHMHSKHVRPSAPSAILILLLLIGSSV